jgi:hypothetical protein
MMMMMADEDDNRKGVVVTGVMTQTGNKKNEGDEWFWNVSG